MSKLMSAAGLKATVDFLRASAAHLDDPQANPAPDPATLLPDAVHGAFTSVTVEVEEPGETEPFIALAINGGEPGYIGVFEYLPLRLANAFGHPIPEEQPREGIDMARFKFDVLVSLELNRQRMEYAPSAEEAERLMDLAFSLLTVKASAADSVFKRDGQRLLAMTIGGKPLPVFESIAFADSRDIAAAMGVDHEIILIILGVSEGATPEEKRAAHFRRPPLDPTGLTVPYVLVSSVVYHATFKALHDTATADLDAAATGLAN